MKKKKLSEYLSFANYVADTVAVELVKNYKISKIDFTKKKNVDNQVITRIDKKVERVVRKLIKTEFPEHNILGEEFNKTNLNSSYTWIIDPIDGTKAYLAGIPVFTFLLSLKYENNYILGIVDQPILKERYWNYDNRAYLNNKIIKTSKCTSFKQAIVAITDPLMFSNYEFLNNNVFKNFNFIRWGTDALGYMRCAEGIIDVVIERDIKIWDIAAIVPIIKASGGIISTWDGNYPGINDTIVASNNKKMHKVLVNTLQKYI